ncbi:helix-turn-helix transcriptional regulator [Arcanobacterium phocae]|uniref:helix-turn-helix transcriptional regulator n=1 Tax=Arcanobacterium phocae TaxID=131112 RepID=UPI001C112BAE|nr:WYL domain-containing protein [Arcanobacterium phocae]
MPTSAEERRFTLLTLLSRSAVSAARIAELPAYREHSGIALQRVIERDIQILRQSGNVIVVDSQYRYQLDNSGTIPIDLSGVDVGALRRVLGTKRRNNVEAFAQFGATKALGNGLVSGAINPYRIKVPVGDSVVDVAQAIVARRQIRFNYSRQGSPACYVIEPWRIEVHFGAFYVSGAVVQRNKTKADGDVRTFRLTRVIGSVRVLESAFLFDQQPTIDSDLNTIDVRLFVSDPAMPLARRGRIVDHRNGGVIVEFLAVDRWDMIDDIVFHGSAVDVLEPEWLRDDIADRLAHAQEVLDELR